MMYWGQMMFQEGGSVFMRQLDYFHDYMLFLFLLILSFVLYWIAFLCAPTPGFRYFDESRFTELMWTVLPMFVLVFLAYPSMAMLYYLEEEKSTDLSLKVTGNQWYWTYLYLDYIGVEFDSYMVPTDELEIGMYRLLDVDTRLVLPCETNIKVVVTASDVIHSWSLPGLGVKMDGTPGRMNMSAFNTGVCGIYYGQCSEICGANHSFMPIVLESVPTVHYNMWIAEVLL